MRSPNAVLQRFNAAPSVEAEAELLDCCSSPAWAAAVTAGRPYVGVQQVLDASDQAFGALSPADIDQALAGHPRIGDRPRDDQPGAQLSRHEQAGVSDSPAQLKQRLREGNAAYEQRFDRVFLIRAAGRDPEEILTELTRRLGNDEQNEAAEVAEQLRQITRLRLEGHFGR